MKTTLVRTSHTLHSRPAMVMIMLTALITFQSTCELVQPPIMHRGLYSALLPGQLSHSILLLYRGSFVELLFCINSISCFVLEMIKTIPLFSDLL